MAEHATGTHDLLFAHLDMWVNMRALLASPWFAHGTHMVTPHRGLGFFRRAACIPLQKMRECTEINATCGFRRHNCTMVKCAGTVWPWFGRSDRTCVAKADHINSRAAACRARECKPHSTNATDLECCAPRVHECCVGWSDLVFLPSRAHTAFRALSAAFSGRSHFAALFAEVAIPTMLNAIAADGRGGGGGGERRAGGDGLLSPSSPPPLRWSPMLGCTGGCCSPASGLSRVYAPLHGRGNASDSRDPVETPPCAHKVALQYARSLRCADESGALPVPLESSAMLPAPERVVETEAGRSEWSLISDGDFERWGCSPPKRGQGPDWTGCAFNDFGLPRRRRAQS